MVITIDVLMGNMMDDCWLSGLGRRMDYACLKMKIVVLRQPVLKSREHADDGR